MLCLCLKVQAHADLNWAHGTTIWQHSETLLVSACPAGFGGAPPGRVLSLCSALKRRRHHAMLRTLAVAPSKQLERAQKLSCMGLLTCRTTFLGPHPKCWLLRGGLRRLRGHLRLGAHHCEFARCNRAEALGVSAPPSVRCQVRTSLFPHGDHGPKVQVSFGAACVNGTRTPANENYFCTPSQTIAETVYRQFIGGVRQRAGVFRSFGSWFVLPSKRSE